MSQIYYYGSDDQVYGPVSELDVQGWYVCGYFSSDVRFQIAVDNTFNPDGFFFTLGELIQLNGRYMPFFFSPEKEKEEKNQDETVKMLMEEMELLRTAHRITQDKMTDQGNVAELKIQVASLVETQADLIRQLKELSNRKESSPVESQLEKKFGDLKKKVEEQEKNFASVKKELSVVNSKCDRNDSKMEKVLEKQKEMEKSANGCGSQISELKNSEKTIRESLNVCEQSVTSSSVQLKSITSELGDIKKEIENQRKDSATSKAQLEAVKKDFCGSLASLVVDKKNFVGSPDDSCTKAEKKEANGSPREKEQEKKAVVDKEVKKAEVGVEEKKKNKKKKESSPWDEKKQPTENRQEAEPWNLEPEIGRAHV